MREDAVVQLRENVSNNVQLYQNDQEWVPAYFKDMVGMETWYLESRILFQKVDLLTEHNGNRHVSKTDAENSKRIHKSLKFLTPAQAVDGRIWTFMTHIVYSDYMKERWLTNKEKIATGTIERYFASTNRELIRNGIARLWWYGYLTYDEDREDPYELTEFLLSNQNLAQSLLERSLGNNKQWLINMLDVMFKLKEEFSVILHSENIKSLAKYINISGGITILDSLSKDATEKLIRDWIQNNLIKLEAKKLISI